MKSFFEEGAYTEIINRINKLEPSMAPLWGKMNTGQMLKHCQMILNIILGKEDYGLKPNWLISLVFKKSMYSDKLWRKNIPAPSNFKIKSDENFEVEKSKILDLINELNENRERENWQPHPIFGTFTKTQWGKIQYKHLDHHLRQFGV